MSKPPPCSSYLLFPYGIKHYCALRKGHGGPHMSWDTATVSDVVDGPTPADQGRFTETRGYTVVWAESKDRDSITSRAMGLQDFYKETG